MAEDFLMLQRGIEFHWIYKDAEYLKIWLTILIRARFSHEPKTDTYNGILYTIQYGQFIYGRPKWSVRLGIGEQKLRGAIKKLLDDNMIKVVKHLSSSTIYEVVNYEKYNQKDLVERWVSAGSPLVSEGLSDKINQPSNHVPDIQRSGIEDDANQPINQVPTSAQPALNQRSTTKEDRYIERRKDIKTIGELISSYTENPEMQNALTDFNAMRIKIRKPMTDRAMKNILSKLNRLAQDDTAKIVILDQSITNSWQDIFPLKMQQGAYDTRAPQTRNHVQRPKPTAEECKLLYDNPTK
jgi:hypothetical protein